jgi:hypothetical protein
LNGILDTARLMAHPVTRERECRSLNREQNNEQMQIISGLWELLLLAVIVAVASLSAYAKGFREGRSEGYHRGRSVGMQIGAGRK